MQIGIRLHRVREATQELWLVFDDQDTDAHGTPRTTAFPWCGGDSAPVVWRMDHLIRQPAYRDPGIAARFRGPPDRNTPETRARDGPLPRTRLGLRCALRALECMG